MLGKGIAECVYDIIRWNQVDEIFHKGVSDDVTKYGDDCTEFQDTQSDFVSKTVQKLARYAWNWQC